MKAIDKLEILQRDYQEYKIKMKENIKNLTE